MTTASTVQVADRAGAVWVTLGPPERLNALDARAIEDIRVATEYARRTCASALVLTGTGPAFTAGGDLAWFSGLVESEDVDGLRESFRRAAQMLWDLADAPFPVVTGVNGVCAAGGLELVCWSDLSVAAESARFLDGHGNVGLLPVAGTVGRLVARIGSAHAARVLLTGDVLSAQDACRLGLVGEVVADHELEGRLLQICAELSGKSAEALRRVKRLMADAVLSSRAAELEVALANAAEPHVREGLRAFLEKRQPRFGATAQDKGQEGT